MATGTAIIITITGGSISQAEKSKPKIQHKSKYTGKVNNVTMKLILISKYS